MGAQMYAWLESCCDDDSIGGAAGCDGNGFAGFIGSDKDESRSLPKPILFAKTATRSAESIKP